MHGPIRAAILFIGSAVNGQLRRQVTRAYLLPGADLQTVYRPTRSIR
jgi:hypothetical protein